MTDTAVLVSLSISVARYLQSRSTAVLDPRGVSPTDDAARSTASVLAPFQLVHGKWEAGAAANSSTLYPQLTPPPDQQPSTLVHGKRVWHDCSLMGLGKVTWHGICV